MKRLVVQQRADAQCATGCARVASIIIIIINSVLLVWLADDTLEKHRGKTKTRLSSIRKPSEIICVSVRCLIHLHYSAIRVSVIHIYISSFCLCISRQCWYFFPMACDDDSDAKAAYVSPADRSIYYDLCVFLSLYNSLYATLWLYSSALHLHDLKGGGLNKLNRTV